MSKIYFLVLSAILLESAAIAEVVSTGAGVGAVIADESADIVVVESVVVSVLVELSLQAIKAVETARAIINFFIFG